MSVGKRKVRRPGNSDHYRFKRLISSRTGQRQPSPSNQAVSGDAGGCKKSRWTPGWSPRPLYGLQKGGTGGARSVASKVTGMWSAGSTCTRWRLVKWCRFQTASRIAVRDGMTILIPQ